MKINQIHHIAIICKDYKVSKQFYTNILGFSIQQEVYRKDRESYKLDLALHGQYLIELFSFPNPPDRISNPEATGLRHIAFSVDSIEEWVKYLQTHQIKSEPIRVDEYTKKKYTFFYDPDNLPIELYESI